GQSRRLVAARGRNWVTGVELAESHGGKTVTRTHECELIAVAATPAPASEAARQHGCRVELRPAAGGFAVLTDSAGQTTVAGVYACGDVCGACGPERAAQRGAEVGRAAAHSLAGYQAGNLSDVDGS
ncbi:MAG: hypothetical protein AAGC55_20815, partial [Myxococcota bacterium]